MTGKKVMFWTMDCGECSLRWPILEEAISQEPLATMEKQKLSWIPKIPGYPPKSSKITFDDIRLLTFFAPLLDPLCLPQPVMDLHFARLHSRAHAILHSRASARLHSRARATLHSRTLTRLHPRAWAILHSRTYATLHPCILEKTRNK